MRNSQKAVSPELGAVEIHGMTRSSFILRGAMSAGAVYGVVVEMEPSVGAWKGAAFGLTLNKLTHESLLPRMGLASPNEEQPTQERISE